MLYTGTNSVVGQLHFRNRLIEERLDCGYQKWGWMEVGKGMRRLFLASLGLVEHT